MMTRYDALYAGVAPLGLPYLVWRYARRRKYRSSAPAMVGLGLPERGRDGERASFADGSLWIHAVSVGEVAAAAAMHPGLRGLFPNLPDVISTITETGQAAARAKMPEAEAHIYFPMDFSWNVRRFQRIYKPKVFVLMETELWPNFLTLARERGTEIYLLNGKISDRSFPKYKLGRRFLSGAFGSLTGICVQTEIDAERFAELGVRPDRIRVTGNCKFDLAIPTLNATERIELRQRLGIGPVQPVVIAGSTHPGEEELVLDAFESLTASIPELCMVIAPRHPERFDEVADLAAARGLRIRRASESENGGGPPQVVILDEMGTLARSYGIGDVAILAGSFAPIGGHNVLEAAAHGIPVIYGPHMHNQREMMRLFDGAGAGLQVEPEDLAGTIDRLLHDSSERKAWGEKALGVLDANQGSARRNIEAIGEWSAINGRRAGADGLPEKT